MGKEVVNLLLIAEGEVDEDGKAVDRRHYTTIKNLSRLLASSNSRNGQKQHFCMNCLQGFPTKISRDKHFEYCKDNETVTIEMPEEGSLVKFHDAQYQFKTPFIMYTDFEAILEPMEGPAPNPEESYTTKINKHIPSGFCVYSKLAYEKVENPLKLYKGEDCVVLFCDYICNVAKRLYHMFPEKPMKRLTRKQWRDYNRATTCHICLKEFKGYDPKVRDHCRYTAQYRRPAHRSCNLRYKIPNYIPIVFHNLSGYDATCSSESGKKIRYGKDRCNR